MNPPLRCAYCGKALDGTGVVTQEGGWRRRDFLCKSCNGETILDELQLRKWIQQRNTGHPFTVSDPKSVYVAGELMGYSGKLYRYQGHLPLHPVEGEPD